MNARTRFHSPARLAATFAAVALSIATAACSTSGARTDSTPPADVPVVLVVRGPVIATVHATGSQIYTCTPDAAGTLAWKLKGPDATFTGDLKGKHYAGPKWAALDGSIVGAAKVAESPAPTPDAIPWLLLKATSHEGSGTLSDVTYIQRLHTSGGKAPPVGSAKAGDEVRVPYTADYVFYGTGAAPAELPK